MNITKTLLPKQSLLHQTDFEYADSFQGTINDQKEQLSTKDIGKAFFNSAPKWTEHLFTLRNKLVAVFGVKTSGEMQDKAVHLENFRCEPNEQIGLFKVYHRNENEVILGEDDRHLNFRVSLYLTPSAEQSELKHLIISTTVHFNNFWGKLYFMPVKQFHQWIVPAMLKGIIRNLEKQLETEKGEPKIS
ncbi:DUF2867 domain-containing protein [Flammeovirga sp. EKP202]|uniref:DUF2867 domain-containing protein n=1 Tax=Flammeovirga sp. EKP202 TaxID=2770592 RepID=UPI00165ECCD4|nr:DUF2867 domain-containing protein [Flammeovirga sp. EKP202]MBD0405354.1 DUF2867 domain-containing protein [Flammeovirga sp. EKP202]